MFPTIEFRLGFLFALVLNLHILANRQDKRIPDLGNLNNMIVGFRVSLMNERVRPKENFERNSVYNFKLKLCYLKRPKTES